MDNQQMGMGGGMGMMNQPKPAGRWHWIHALAGYKAKFLVVLSGLALILAWVASFRGTVFGLIAPHYYWDSLILGVLGLAIHVVWGKCDKTC